jgi:spectinomycin phosphotransferase
MLEKPAISNEAIGSGLTNGYGIQPVRIEFLPLGKDSNGWVYRVETADQTPYFLKLKRPETVNPASLAVPRYLRDHGIWPVVAPLPTRTGALAHEIPEYTLVLYPFVEGRSGREVGLSPEQWLELGAIVRAVHQMELPPRLAANLPRETFVPHARYAGVVRRLLRGIGEEGERDDLARELACYWQEKREEIARLLQRAEELGQALQHRKLPFTLCHADIHVANVLVEPSGHLLVVDWDQPILAPKERDLMFVMGSALRGFSAGSAEEAAFFRGYGSSDVDQVALAYYRYEWAIQDLGAYAEAVYFRPDLGEADRREGVAGVRAVFLPGSEAEAAYAAEADLYR